MTKNILDLNEAEAERFFLRGDSYFDGDLPKYFQFSKFLYNINQAYKKSNINIKEACRYDNVNYSIYVNKDGNYAWRKLQIINPILYVDLINLIVKTENWNEIKSRFHKLQRFCKNKIICTSIPVAYPYQYKSIKSTQILEWWEKTEQMSLSLANEYLMVVTTDIADCYPSIYTHTISWSLYGLNKAKRCKNDSNLLGNKIDKKIMNLQYGQTNGIPQGTIVMTLFAELILAYADVLLVMELKKYNIKYKILRYRDDYKIFVNSQYDGEIIIKELSKVLILLNLKLNSSKTTFYNNIIDGALKKDKMYAIQNENNFTCGTLYKRLIKIYLFLCEYQNSKQMVKYLIEVNNDILNYINDNKLNKTSIAPLIGICISISLKNPSVAINCCQIISTLIEQLSKDEAISIIKQVTKIFSSIQHSLLITIYIQRIGLTYDLYDGFNEKICEYVKKEKKGELCKNIELWNCNWVKDKKFLDLINNEKFILKVIIDNLSRKISKREIDIFCDLY